MRAFVMCAGEAERWGGYLGVPKQLVSVDREPLLHRTVRELARRGVTDVFIVSENLRLGVPGATLFVPGACRWLVESIVSTAPLWDDENIFLLGDVWFTPDALDKIVRDRRELAVFGRAAASLITGCPYGELFALRIAQGKAVEARRLLRIAIRMAELFSGEAGIAGAAVRIRTMIRLCRDAVRCGRLGRTARQALGLFPERGPWRLQRLDSSLWSTLRLLFGRSDADVHVVGRLWSFYRLGTGQSLSAPLLVDDNIFVSIDDWTEDFDFPEDFDRWRARYRREELSATA